MDSASETATQDVRCVSMPEAAERLNLSLRATRDLVKRGELPAAQIGRRIVVPMASLAEFVRAHMAPAPPAAL